MALLSRCESARIDLSCLPFLLNLAFAGPHKSALPFDWSECDKALARSGDITLWGPSDALKFWTTARSGRLGVPTKYLDLAHRDGSELAARLQVALAPGRRIPAFPASHQEARLGSA